MESMVQKLKKLKKIVKTWIKRKGDEDRRELIQTEGLIKKILVKKLTTNFFEEDRVQLNNLELKRMKF